jgi:hypothetical protein
MKSAKKTFYGYVRRTAYDLWRGPDYISDPDENSLLSGSCVLRLAIRKGETAKPMIEARAVYTILHPDGPQDAILRAVYWDSKTVAHSSNRYDSTPFKIPAKFVQIPLTLLQPWISSLENLQTSIQTSSHEDDSLPICTLRVETEAVSSVFEKTWQVVEGENSELNRIWQGIWQQMGLALATAPIITGLEESFPCIKPEIDVYDLQAYKPSLDLP